MTIHLYQTRQSRDLHLFLMGSLKTERTDWKECPQLEAFNRDICSSRRSDAAGRVMLTFLHRADVEVGRLIFGYWLSYADLHGLAIINYPFD